MLRRFKSSVTFLMKLLAFLLCAACFFGLWLLSLGWSLYRARRCRFTLELQGNRLAWQAESYTLGAASRVAPGFLWLALEGKSRQRLWLWADSVAAADYRRLARHIVTVHRPRLD